MTSPSFTNNPPKRKRWVRRLLWTVLLIATAVPLYYAFENWRGAKAWTAAREAYEAKGRTLDWDTLLSAPPVDEADNFFAIPLLKGIHTPDDDDAEARRSRLLGPSLSGLSGEQRTALAQARDFENGKPLDYEAFRKALGTEGGIPMPTEELDHARAILRGIEGAIDWFDELDAASATGGQAQLVPLSGEYFDRENPWAFTSPHLSPMRGMMRWLCYRASAAVGCREKTKAKDSLTSAFRIVEAMRQEPTLIAYLVNITQTAMLARPLWDSLHERIWTDVDLQWLERELSQIDLVEGYRRSLATEAAFMATATDRLKNASMKDLQTYMGIVPDGGGSAPFLRLKLYPDGRFDREKARGLVQISHIQSALEKPALTHLKDTSAALIVEAAREPASPFDLFGTVAMFSKVGLSTAQMQTLIHQTRIAVALERHYLIHQRYPNELDELVPDAIPSLPPDPMGEAWRYRPNAELDDYRLYSVGWNLLDDGGLTSDRTRRETGDYVWFR